MVLVALGADIAAQEAGVRTKVSSVEKIPDPSYRPKRGDHAVAYAYDEKRDRVYPPAGARYSFAYEEYWKAIDIDDDDGIEELRIRNLLTVTDFGGHPPAS